MNRPKAAFFDNEAMAPWAAAAYGEEERPKIARLLAAADLTPGARVLEVGCGTGRLTEVLADAVGPSGAVLALDISPRMVAACRARIGPRRHVKLVQAAVEEYDITHPVDAVVCHQVFPHFDDKPTALARLARGLRPGGCLLIVHFISAARVNAVHQQADPILHQDLLPPLDAMSALLGKAGLIVDWSVEDALGYLVRARRLASAIAAEAS